jgi:anti-anti-sigma regulatory factor
MDEQAGYSEQLLLTLCRGSTGDVHLDLAELDSIDLTAVLALLRGAAALGEGRHLVLHNPPSSLAPILEMVGGSSVRVEGA